MGLYIPDVKLPPDDKMDLVLCIRHDGTVFNPWGTELGKAIELPPHGDLIDREKIPFVEFEYACDDYVFRYDINEMTPVIPAEEE